MIKYSQNYFYIFSDIRRIKYQRNQASNLSKNSKFKVKKIQPFHLLISDDFFEGEGDYKYKVLVGLKIIIYKSQLEGD